ncbi:MAG: hypothetical protein IIB28_01255 [Chloroflexi bacterium]|nr:hypothetical protein [Chloroflexota bacterium]
MPAGTKAVSYPVRRRLGGLSDYTLFYASKNESGIELWHEEIGRHFRSLHQGAGTNTPQASFLPEVTLEIRQAEIRELVQSRISETGGATGQQLIDWIRLDREDYILSNEISDALRELEMQGYVAREDGRRGYKHVKFIPSSPPPEQGTFQL